MTRLREALSIWFIDIGLWLMPYDEIEEMLRVSIYMTTSTYLSGIEEEDYD